MYVINKLEGETPLEALESFRLEKGIDLLSPMTYAGRLDPMAEGLLLILFGDECKKKGQYLGLDKEYDLEVLLGVGSDTGDILGIIGKYDMRSFEFEDISLELIQEKINMLIGKRTEKYPAFSSKPMKGKPMFMHAKEGKLIDFNEDEIPQKEIEIYSIDFISKEIINQTKLVETAIKRIGKVKGDFRQKEIINFWNNLLKNEDGYDMHLNQFSIIKLHVKSSSGAYMRTLAQKLGESLCTKALAWKIKRTKIGEYALETAFL